MFSKYLLSTVLLINIVFAESTVIVTATRDYRVATLPATGTESTNSDGLTTITKTTSVSGTQASSSLTGQTTAITSCHFHDTIQYCINGEGVEGTVNPAPTKTENAPTSYTGCHSHGEGIYCLDESGDEVSFVAETSEHTEESSSSGVSCHFHAGVEHCVGGESTESCERTERDYNIPLRIGTLFAMLVVSAIGSFGPIILTSFLKFSLDGLIVVIIKQFGTGVIISTALVHLITHSQLMWQNSCLTGLGYESTGTAIVMAGIFLSFLLEYFSNKTVQWRSSKKIQTNHEGGNSVTKEEEEVRVIDSDELDTTDHDHSSIRPDDKMTVMALEAGIIFHSVLIGLTLVVAGDSYFITLFIVILFHQLFEGLALGSRIAGLKESGMITKLVMAFLFAITTPVGMAIGIGVLKSFNGNDRSTLIALGTLDSFSAGILIWTGCVEMWAHDWIFGSLARAPAMRSAIALFALICGLLIMSVLGKWA